MDYYQRTKLQEESLKVLSIQFGNSDLIIEGPHFNRVTSQVRSQAQAQAQQESLINNNHQNNTESLR